MLKTFITIFMLGVLVSFHESMGVLALIPLGVCATMVAIGLAIERRGWRRVGLTPRQKSPGEICVLAVSYELFYVFTACRLGIVVVMP